MSDDIDAVPWDQLGHAYGTASDVPDLLRALRDPRPASPDTESALYEFFGNIWHQGTVYEATSYAVPFLIEIVAAKDTPDRPDILALLAAIATGRARSASPVAKTEMTRAHTAVAAGFTDFVRMTDESDAAVRFGAAHVLAVLPHHAQIVRPMLRDLLRAERVGAQRAAYLVLIGLSRDDSPESLEMLHAGFRNGTELERTAALYAIARARIEPRTDLVQDAIVDLLAGEMVEARFEEIAWSINANTFLNASETLFEYLGGAARSGLAQRIMSRLELGRGTDESVHLLLDVIFGPSDRARCDKRRAAELNPLQARVVRALAKQMAKGLHLHHSFESWGLPQRASEFALFAWSIPASGSRVADSGLLGGERAENG